MSRERGLGGRMFPSINSTFPEILFYPEPLGPLENQIKSNICIFLSYGVLGIKLVDIVTK